MPDIKYLVGDPVKVGKNSLGIILPNNKILIVPMDETNHNSLGTPTLDIITEKTIIWPLEREFINKQDPILRFAFKVLLTSYSIDASWIEVKGMGQRDQR